MEILQKDTDYVIAKNGNIVQICFTNNDLRYALFNSIPNFQHYKTSIYSDHHTLAEKELMDNTFMDLYDIASAIKHFLYYTYFDDNLSLFSVLENLKGEQVDEDETIIPSFLIDRDPIRAFSNASLIKSLVVSLNSSNSNIGFEERQKISTELKALNDINKITKDQCIDIIIFSIKFLCDNVSVILKKFENNELLSSDEIFECLINYQKPLAIEIEKDNYIISEIYKAEKHKSMMGIYYSYNFKVTEIINNEISESSVTRYFTYFKDKCSSNSIGISIPTDDIKNTILSRSLKYLEYTKNPSYLFHTGHIQEKLNYFSSIMHNATGRCMVDVNLIREINPNFNDYFPPKDYDSSRQPINSFDNIESISEDVRLKLTPYVYIFSFIAKKWAKTLINNLSEINFREDAFQKLIIDQNVKDLMFALVDSSGSNPIIGKDIIDNKGGGSIFLLAGPPGSGKTLSAETIAEALQKPLYMIGVGELGTDPEQLEFNLTKVLNTAAAWDAVLLLDECDIFMEKRQEMDVYRNAMVSIFLRLLEYYRGILFLTTNRSNSIDDAFFSRISLALQYEALDSDKRNIIWQNQINLYKDVLPSDLSIDTSLLSTFDINGRQIKNAVKLTIKYCNYIKQDPSTNHFVFILNQMINFNKPVLCPKKSPAKILL